MFATTILRQTWHQLLLASRKIRYVFWWRLLLCRRAIVGVSWLTWYWSSNEPLIQYSVSRPHGQMDGGSARGLSIQGDLVLTNYTCNCISSHRQV